MATAPAQTPSFVSGRRDRSPLIMSSTASDARSSRSFPFSFA
jgi:hypothetical protein